jgi:hypothetical protein
VGECHQNCVGKPSSEIEATCGVHGGSGRLLVRCEDDRVVLDGRADDCCDHAGRHGRDPVVRCVRGVACVTGRISADGPELAAAKRLLDLAKDQSFVFQRVAPGEDGPLLGVRESPEYRDQIYLGDFYSGCTATRARKSSLIVPGACRSPRG